MVNHVPRRHDTFARLERLDRCRDGGRAYETVRLLKLSKQVQQNVAAEGKPDREHAMPRRRSVEIVESVENVSDICAAAGVIIAVGNLP